MAGDFLIFSLTALSEFEVYMFPGTGSRNEALFSQLAPRKWSNGSVFPMKKAKQSYECKNEQLSAAKSTEGAVKSSGLLVAKKEINPEELPTEDSKPVSKLRSFTDLQDFRELGYEVSHTIELSCRANRLGF